MKEGPPFEVGNQVLISSHRKLLSSKALTLWRGMKMKTPPRGRAGLSQRDGQGIGIGAAPPIEACAAAMGRSAENDNHLATGFVGLHDAMRFADFLEPKYSRRLGFQEA
jgi:hypothetical protein